MTCEQTTHAPRTRARWSDIDWAAIDWTAVNWAETASPRINWVDFYRGAPTLDVAGGTIRPARGTSAATDTKAADIGADHDDAAASWPARREFPVTVFGIRESQPGPRWKALFDATWPAYRSWYQTGAGVRPDLNEARGMLEKHMPELMPTWRKLVELTGNDDVAARFLTMWNLPAFAPACSQVALTGKQTSLTRNYDYVPSLWEATVYSSEFTGRKVLGTGDCLWGLLDGMNDAGLAVSLTFGGRPGSGPGFAIPIVIRYLLEVAETAQQARELLRELPVSMSYNITVVDTSGERFTAFVAPGQKAEFFDACTATNHRGKEPEYPAKAAQFCSVERLVHLDRTVETEISADEMRDQFLEAPLYQDNFSGGFGTLFTAHYRPDEGSVEYRWPGVSWKRGFEDADDTRNVVLVGR
ncbi:peptidase C45 [Kocuria sp. cx-455]|uniref:C45 family autoproteolytic acyltransferase/hydolase n=1 Tax=Kocuria sp. cx-455 TaxID=2771377 RepID=UPI001686733B|nr:C45 family peptidase [Kocuria sp. cx-455]MBD2765197.1 peptidase C45 [Kocuria sp. cx-455]